MWSASWRSSRDRNSEHVNFFCDRAVYTERRTRIVNLSAGHLTDAQIEAYLQGTSGESLGLGDDQRIGRHLSECGSCLEVALQAQRAQLGFLVRPPASQAPSPDCPDEDVIRRFAAGDLSEAGSDLIHHLVRCNFCGPLLQRFREDFSNDFTPEDTAFLSRLKTSNDSWRKKFVRRHAPLQRDSSLADKILAWAGSGRATTRRRWAVAAACAIIVIALVPLAVIEAPVIADKIRQNKAEDLAIQSFSDQPTEIRIPDARYSPYQKEMGPPSSSKSPALLEAQSIVATKQRAGHLDRKWLQLEGLTALLD